MNAIRTKVAGIAAAAALAAVTVGCASSTPARTADARPPVTHSASAAPSPYTCPKGSTEGSGGACITVALARKQLREQHAAQLAAEQSARRAARARQAARRLAHTITYVVTGDSADVTYGPDGSDTQGTVPMDVSARLATPQYYAISAQLNGGGIVTVKIEIGGKVISQGTASGSYNIATAEISQDPLSGQWTDVNGG